MSRPRYRVARLAAVHLLIEESDSASRVVGYYAISPAQISRADAPASVVRGWPRSVPAWRIGKLAIHLDLRDDKDAQWGAQLLRHALETIVSVADAGGGKVIVVDADNAGLLGFYERNGFLPAGGRAGLTIYMKVSTAWRVLARD